MTVETVLYEKNPPQIQVIKITRSNYEEVAAYIEAKRVTVSQGDLDVYKTVTMHFPIDSDLESLVFKIPVDLATNYEAYIYRDLSTKNKKWSVIRQYDLAWGYHPVKNND